MKLVHPEDAKPRAKTPRKKPVAIVVGKSYTFTFPGGDFGRGQVDYTVVSEEVAETVRFKKKVEGYRLLILDTRGFNPWANDGVTPGHHHGAEGRLHPALRPEGGHVIKVGGMYSWKDEHGTMLFVVDTMRHHSSDKDPVGSEGYLALILTGTHRGASWEPLRLPGETFTFAERSAMAALAKPL